MYAQIAQPTTRYFQLVDKSMERTVHSMAWRWALMVEEAFSDSTTTQIAPAFTKQQVLRAQPGSVD
ncbi:hypothetical protein DAPPUDRAFT_257303 [Daphnia pulex]|uniref:Uncharacterized protein n=1 Tax=Daphnia pulex TaxID=6669 RepID=E9HDA9_DAPPU|nr:hypothetical protein DAPPUDRAFT_257303 [Daphnia pulex]|eukprot:EFX70222.1 hypothetical protein DAPPUDRAFT_257303 [Daphnia pulex]